MMLSSILAGALLLAAVPAGAPALAPGTYQYAGTVNGERAGTSSLTVTTDGAVTTIDESASGSMSGMQFSGKASLVLGGDLSPTKYDGNYTISGQNATVNASLTPTAATVTSSATGGQAQTIALPPDDRHFVVIEPGLLAGLFALPAQMQAWQNAGALAIAPAYAHGESLVPAGAASPPPRPSGVPAQDAAISFAGRLPFTIWYDPSTFVPDAIVVPSRDATVLRVRG